MSTTGEQAGAFSVFEARPYWYIACRSSDLRKELLQVRLWGEPLVLFRDEEGVAHCLRDRCAHRNVPLSEGKCIGSRIQCPYHGWEFDGEGRCQKVPALPDFQPSQAHAVPSFSVTEQQGYVWVYTEMNATPHAEPFLFPHLDDSEYVSVHYQADFEATLHATAENILDVPHTAFLHKGLFRGGEPNPIETVVRSYTDRVECEFVGEPRPSGLLGKILAPGGGDQMQHVDRFLLPSVAQVEYKIGHRGHLLTTSCLSPLSTFETRMYAVVTLRKSLWLQLLRPVITPLAMKVVQQDQEMLAKQTQRIRDYGGEQYAYTEADTLGPGIIKLLRQATKEKIAIAPGQADETELGEAIALKRGTIWA